MAYGSNKVGDIPVDKTITVIALVAPPIMLSRLADPEDVINQAHLSGKQVGAIVLAVTGGTVAVPTAVSFYSATGSAPGDSWVEVGTSSE